MADQSVFGRDFIMSKISSLSKMTHGYCLTTGYAKDFGISVLHVVASLDLDKMELEANPNGSVVIIVRKRKIDVPSEIRTGDADSSIPVNLGSAELQFQVSASKLPSVSNEIIKELNPSTTKRLNILVYVDGLSDMVADDHSVIVEFMEYMRKQSYVASTRLRIATEKVPIPAAIQELLNRLILAEEAEKNKPYMVMKRKTVTKNTTADKPTGPHCK